MAEAVHIRRRVPVFFNDLGVATSPDVTQITRSGEVLGTLSYVAPEVLDNSREADVQKADYFSVGQILIAASGMRPNPDGTVPDVYYAYTPTVARLLEDLLQGRPADRMRLLKQALATSPHAVDGAEALRKRFHDEVTIVHQAVAFHSGQNTSRPLFLLRKIRQPFEAPIQQLRLWRGLSDLESSRTPVVKLARSLSFWSCLSAFTGLFAFGVVMKWFGRDLGWDYSSDLFQSLETVTHAHLDPVPWIDRLAAPGYEVGNAWHNWKARVVALSYLLVGARYYQALFSGISPLLGAGWGGAGPRARAASAMMRAETFIAPVLVAIVTLWSVDWWPIAAAIGQTCTVVCNFAVASFVGAALRQAQQAKVSTVPANNDEITGYFAFRSWWPSSLIYAAVTWAVALFIVHHKLRDETFYALVVVALNVGLFYFVKCGTNAPTIRVALTRACLAAERLRVRAPVSVPLPPSPRSPVPDPRGERERRGSA